MNKSPIEIAVGQTNILIEDEVCKAVGKVGIHINKKELLKALKAYEFVEELTNYIFAYPDDDYMTMECLCRKLFKYGLIDKKDGYYLVADGIKADRKTEPQIRCPKCGRMDYIKNLEKDFGVKDDIFKYKCINCNTYIKDEPTTEDCSTVSTCSKMEQVEDEPQTEKHKCRRCLYYDISSDYYPCSECVDYSNYSGEVEDEPQTEREGE